MRVCARAFAARSEEAEAEVEPRGVRALPVAHGVVEGRVGPAVTRRMARSQLVDEVGHDGQQALGGGEVQGRAARGGRGASVKVAREIPPREGAARCARATCARRLGHRLS